MTIAPTVDRARPLSQAQIALGCVVGAAALLIGVLGAYVSYETVQEAMRPSFGPHAWTVPIAADVGILVFSALDLWMAWVGYRTRWLRWVPASLVAVTVYLNVAQEPTLYGKVGHAVLPVMWVVCVEVGAHVIRLLAQIRGAARTARERIPAVRWALALVPTALMWRRMVLRGHSTVAEAQATDDNMAIVRARLRDQYRFWWRLRAPRELRALYKRGLLVPDAVETVVIARPAPALEPPADLPPAPSSNGHEPERPVEEPEIEVPEKMWADACALVDSRFEGRVPGRQRFMPVLRAEHGHRASSRVAEELMRRLKARQETAA